jgi:hypothetical protein
MSGLMKLVYTHIMKNRKKGRGLTPGLKQQPEKSTKGKPHFFSI